MNTTTTTATPAWATTWAIMPELPTATAENISKGQSHRKTIANIWDNLKDYAAGTLEGIWNQTAKRREQVRQVATAAALFVFRFVWFASIFCATFAVLALLSCEMTNVLPHFWPLRLVVFAVIGALSVAFEVLLIMATRRIDRATDHRLFNMY